MRVVAMAMRVVDEEEGEGCMAMVMVKKIAGKQRQWQRQQRGQW
jgi:hypothetical protein